MTKVALEPPRELRRLAARIEAGCGMFLAGRGNSASTSEWEALRHAWLLSNLALRGTEATAVLARTDQVLQPPAWATARSSVEAAARCLWILEPDDVWEREARWLALLEEGARFGERDEMQRFPSLNEQSKEIRSFVAAVKAKLPPHVTVPGTPTVQSILLDQGGDALPSFYVMASQYAHAAEYGTRQWRSGLGLIGGATEEVSLAGWYWLLWNAWLAFRITALRLIEVRGDSLSATLVRVDAQVKEARESFLSCLE